EPAPEGETVTADTQPPSAPHVADRIPTRSVWVFGADVGPSRSKSSTYGSGRRRPRYAVVMPEGADCTARSYGGVSSRAEKLPSPSVTSGCRAPSASTRTMERPATGSSRSVATIPTMSIRSATRPIACGSSEAAERGGTAEPDAPDALGSSLAQ